MMPVREFIKLVWKMREKQIDYFQNKGVTRLIEAKEAEKGVDKELGRYMSVIDPHKGNYDQQLRLIPDMNDSSPDA